MKRFWKHDVEYCQLQGEQLIAAPLLFGPITLKLGDRIAYMGDGRKHRSFQMIDGYSLQYCGYILIDNTRKALLFTVPEQPQFKKHGIYYVFYDLNLNNAIKSLWLIRGPSGGGRDIILKKVKRNSEGTL